MENEVTKVSRMKDIVDTLRLNAKMVAAAAGALATVGAAIIEINDCRSSKRLKRSDPDKYWRLKNEKQNLTDDLLAKAANKFVDFIIDASKK